MALRGFMLLLVLALFPPLAHALDNAFWPEVGETWGEGFSIPQEVVKAGDFNGDGKTDLVIFTRDARPAPQNGDVRVALSDGARFAAPQLWHDYFGVGQEVPLVGDFNGDGKDDIATVVRDGTQSGNVWIAYSDGERFGQSVLAASGFCTGTQVPVAGDVNGDGADDLLCFVRSTPRTAPLLLPGAKELGEKEEKPVAQNNGDVYVALFFKGKMGKPARWATNFCLNTETPMAADFNGDGKADIITFVGGDGGNAWVALSNGAGFDPSAQWGDRLCLGQEVPAVGRFNDDRFADVASFVRSSRRGAETGDVYVALTELLPAPMHFGPRVKRHDWFSVGNEQPVVGDFDGDRKDDLATINAAGRAFVVHSGFNRPVDWVFSLPRYILRSRDEVSGDDPYFVVIGFRSRFGTPGSTQVYWNGDLRETATNIDAGSQVNVPAAMGTLVIPNITQFTIPDGILLRKPEVVGVIVIAMDSDGTPFGDIRDLVNRIKDQGVRTALQRVVEQRPLPMTEGAVQQLITDANGAMGDIVNAMKLSDWDIVGLFVRSLFDVDDFIDYHVFLYLAADEDCQRFLNTNVALPAGVDFGRLAEKTWTFSNTAGQNHPISFNGRTFNMSGNTTIDANFTIRYARPAPPAVPAP